MAQLKYTTFKNFKADIIVPSNTSSLTPNSSGGVIYNSNSFPRAAMVRISLKSGVSGLTDPYSDDAEYFDSNDGFYVIGVNDLCIQESYTSAGLVAAGLSTTSGTSATYSEYHNPTGVSSAYKGIPSSYNNAGPNINNVGTVTSMGLNYNMFPLYKTEYDPINGVTGSRLFQDINASIPSSNTSQKYKIWTKNNLSTSMPNNPHLSKIKQIMMIDTVGRDGGATSNATKAFQGNKVLMFVIFEEGVSIDDDTTIQIPVRGRPRFVDSGYEYSNGLVGGVGSQYRKRRVTRSNVNVDLKFKDTLDVEVNQITSSVAIQEAVKTHNQIVNDIDLGIKSFRLTGTCLSHRFKKIAEVKLTAPSGEHFSIKPTLKTRYNNLILKLKDKTVTTDERDRSNKITYYCYDLMYKSEQSSSKTDIVKATLIAETKTIPTKTLGITNLSFGSSVINEKGETRDIKIHGAPSTNFKILVNESIVDKTTHGDEEYLDFSLTNDTSILVAANDVVNTLSGKLRCLSGIIPKSGVFSFKQIFPSNVVNRNRVSGGKTGETNQDFSKSLTNVRVGDRLYTKGISPTNKVNVTTLGTDTRISAISSSVTTVTGAQAQFRRERYYNIQFDPETTILNSSIKDITRLVQPETIDILITNNAGSSYVITSNNGSATSFSAGDDLTLKYSGTSNKSKALANTTNVGMSSYQNSSIQKVSILLTLSDAADRFTAVQVPVVDNKDQSKSSFTNSVYSENGGTIVKLFNFSHSAVNTSNTITLTYFFEITRVGSKDVTMTLNLDDILTIQDN